MKLENISNGKIIGIGEVTVLPGETKDIPEAYETSPILEVYKRNGFAKITGKPKSVEKSEAEKAAEEADAAKKAAEDAEALRQARLAALKGSARKLLERWQTSLASIRLSARIRQMF